MENLTVSIRITLSVVALAAIALTGCTATQHEVTRTEAQERVGIMNAQLSYDQARQSFGAGQFDKAMRDVTMAIQRYPSSAQYYLLQGRIFMETHRLEQALDSFHTASEKDAKLADAHYFAGIVHERWSDDDSAYREYSLAFELAPTSVQYLLAMSESLISLQKYEQAKALIVDKLSYFEHNAALRHLLGQIALLQKNPETAAQLYAEARLLNPDDPQILEELTHAQFEAGQYAKCLQSVKWLQEMSSTPRQDLMLTQARCLTFMNRPEDARSVYMELSRMSPSSNDPIVWIELGAIAWELGDYRRVALCGQQAVSLAPNRYEGYMLKALNESYNNDMPTAISFMREAASRAPSTALPHVLLGEALKKAGDFEGATAAFAAAFKADPTNTIAQAMWASVETDGQTP